MSYHLKSQMAESSENQEEKTPEAPQASTSPERQTITEREKSPVMAIRDGILDSGSSIACGIRSIDDQVRTALRYQLTDQEEYSFLESPFMIAGNAIDATAGNIARRALEVAEPIGNAAEAAVKGTVGAVLQPINTFKQPIEFLKKPLKIGTSLLRAASNVVKSAINGAHDIMERGVERNFGILKDKLSSIPLIGKVTGLFGKLGHFVSKIGSGLTGILTKIQNKLFSPIDAIDEAVKI